MSEQKSPLVNIAASLAATVKCCVSSDTNTTTTTTITGNSENTIAGNPSQAVTPLVRNASTMSTDLTPIVEETQA
jgi:hypothetical protein